MLNYPRQSPAHALLVPSLVRVRPTVPNLLLRFPLTVTVELVSPPGLLMIPRPPTLFPEMQHKVMVPLTVMVLSFLPRSLRRYRQPLLNRPRMVFRPLVKLVGPELVRMVMAPLATLL